MTNKEYNLKEVGARVKRIRSLLNLNQSEFGKALQLSRSFVSEVEKGNVRCGFDFIYYLSEKFNVNLYYLVHGEGDVFRDTEQVPSFENKNPGDPVESVAELNWYIERSPLMLHSLLSFATKFIYDNEFYIKKEIEKYEKKQLEQSEQAEHND